MTTPPAPFRITTAPLADAAAATRWEACRRASAQCTPYAALPFAEAAAGTLGYRAEIVLVEADGRDAGGVVVFSRRRGPYREVVVPAFTAFTPFVLAAAQAPEALMEALMAALAGRYDVLRFHLHPSMSDVRACRRQGWTATPLYTYRQPLAPPEAFRAAWSSAPRRLFRKAHGRFEVEEAGTDAGVAARLCLASYLRSGKAPPVRADRLAVWIDALREAGLVRLFTATPAGGTEAAAAVAFLHDGATAHYWVAGSEPGPAMTVLLGTALPILHADGLTTFDWVGANTPSIAEFKRRFGPTLVPYYRIEKIRPAPLRLYHALRG